MVATLKNIAKQFPDRVAKAIFIEAQIIMTESKRRCPVASDGGTLRASGRVNPPERQGRLIWCTLSYGGAATPYALAVHEHLSEHSPPSWIRAEQDGHGIHWTSAGTGPKFLENPIKEAQPTLAQKIAQRISFDQPDVLG